MYQQEDDERFKKFQKFIPNATPESFKDFENCMKTDAIYKRALPCGLVGMLISHLMIPKRWGIGRAVTTTMVGLSMYIFGKVTYSPVCMERAFGSQVLHKLRERSTRDLFGDTDKFSELEEENKSPGPSDNTMGGEMEWNAFDSQFENNSPEYSDANINLQEEWSDQRQNDEKRRLTYDDLWTQHKERTKERSKDHYGYASTGEIRLSRSQQKKLTEGSTVPKMEVEERNTDWNE